MGGRIGSSSDNEQGLWDHSMTKETQGRKIGAYHFYRQDAQQWAAWNIDYLKYDWNPIEKPETQEMAAALRDSGRDIVYSLSNSTPFRNAADVTPLANCWRVCGDDVDTWDSIRSNGFDHDEWAPFARPGHWK